jgi:hypothetical protein
MQYNSSNQTILRMLICVFMLPLSLCSQADPSGPKVWEHLAIVHTRIGQVAGSVAAQPMMKAE